ncbi:hypothetical protein BH10CHL1_BH10CHL1_08800 [soil metagenome]
MQAYDVIDLLQESQKQGKPWLEFLRMPTLSMGLYTLPAGGVDQQQPHTEDEVYCVVSGSGTIQVDGEDRLVATGSIIYVAANVKHHFHTITEALAVLVFFAPAEYTNQ